MKKNITLFLIMIVLLQVSMLLAQRKEDYPNDSVDLIESLYGYKRAGQTIMPFLALGGGARIMGMGDAGMAMIGNASALFYNPAGLAYVEKNSVLLGNMNWLIDTDIRMGALAVNLGPSIGVIGASFMVYDYGDPITATEIDAGATEGYNIIGEMNPIEFAIGLGYARQISNQFAIGAQVKYAYQDLLGSGGVKTRIAYQEGETWVQEEHDANRGILAFDFGTVYNTGFRDLTFAMSIRNFGGEIKYERESFNLPLTLRFGVNASYNKIVKKNSELSDIILNIDYLHPRDWSERVNIGIEYVFKEMFYLRSGYKYNYTSEGYCLGGGVRINSAMGKIGLDYAYKDTSETMFESVHVYSVCFNF